MKSSLLALSLAGAMLGSTAFAHEPAQAASTSASTISEAAQPAVAVVEDFSRALKGGDFKRVGELLTDDVLILESGGAERSREEYLGHHAISDAAFLKDAHSALKHRTARVEGDIAWIGTESELHAKKDGKPMTLLSTETMVLRRTDAGWRIAHIHWSSRPKR